MGGICLASTVGLSGGGGDGAQCLVFPTGYILPFCASQKLSMLTSAGLAGALWLTLYCPALYHTICTNPQQLNPPACFPPISDGVATSHNGPL